MTLTEFLLARIADDEAEEQRIQDEPAGSAYDYAQVETHSISYRVLEECAVKRRIVETAMNYSPELADGDNGEWAFDQVLRMMAMVYMDHSTYNQAWTP